MSSKGRLGNAITGLKWQILRGIVKNWLHAKSRTPAIKGYGDDGEANPAAAAAADDDDDDNDGADGTTPSCDKLLDQRGKFTD